MLCEVTQVVPEGKKIERKSKEEVVSRRADPTRRLQKTALDTSM